jgi:hypothetical protein
MTASSLLERIKQRPFRPFAVETIGGTSIDVEEEADIVLRKKGNREWVVIFASNGAMYVFEPDQISGVEVK